MERLKNAHIEGIQNEYRRINATWLQMHYRMLRDHPKFCVNLRCGVE